MTDQPDAGDVPQDPLFVEPVQISKSSNSDTWRVVAKACTFLEQTVSIDIKFEQNCRIGKGAFGSVCKALLVEENAYVAIKAVLATQHGENELAILKMLDHCNVVELKYFYRCSCIEAQQLFFVMDYLPTTIHGALAQYRNSEEVVPIIFVKLWMYQLFRGLAYIHSLGICHRDVKPANILLNPGTGVLKLCDFGWSAQITPGAVQQSYVVARWYRAPELLLGATNYTTSIDVWSAGCVLAELILKKPIFKGKRKTQLFEIVIVLGTPLPEQIVGINPNRIGTVMDDQITSKPWQSVFPPLTPRAFIDLCGDLLKFSPTERLRPLNACAHSFFDELREEGKTLPGGAPLPPLFNFTPEEEQQAGALITDL